MGAGRPRTVKREVHPLFELLAEERREQGLTQTMLAQRMGTISAESISKLERGVNPGVKIDTLERWVHALGFDLAYSLEPNFEEE